jgi:LmbE family N-acetylglucosaminyl deacetylase
MSDDWHVEVFHQDHRSTHPVSLKLTITASDPAATMAGLTAGDRPELDMFPVTGTAT